MSSPKDGSSAPQTLSGTRPGPGQGTSKEAGSGVPLKSGDEKPKGARKRTQSGLWCLLSSYRWTELVYQVPFYCTYDSVSIISEGFPSPSS